MTFEEKLEAIAKYAGPLGLGLGDLGQVALRYTKDAEEKADSRTRWIVKGFPADFKHKRRLKISCSREHRAQGD